ncbi:hypothetical protein HDU67_008921, partial [Dinochytrium kinnereticum]
MVLQNPIRHLILYVHLSGVKGGFLFPQNIERFQDNGHDGYGVEPFSHELLNHEIQQICSVLMARQRRIGTHTLQRTAYTLAVFGDAEERALMQSARHATHKIALPYKGDASFQLRLAQVNDKDPSTIVSKFTGILCSNQRTRSKIREAATQDLPQLAWQFIVERCGFHLNHPCRTVSTMAKEMLSYKKLGSVEERLIAAIRQVKNAQLERSISRLIYVYVLEKMHKRAVMSLDPELHGHSYLASLTQDILANRPSSSVILPPTVSTQEVITKKATARGSKRRGGDLVLHDRCKLKTARNGVEKVRVLLKIRKEALTVISRLANGDRQFYLKQLLPVLSCLDKHFNGDVERFVEHWKGNIKPSVFKQNNCDS